MKVELDPPEIDKIAEQVALKLRPMLAQKPHAVAADTVLDVDALASYLSVDKSWIYKAVQQRSIPFFKCGRYTRFDKRKIDAWIDTQTMQTVMPITLTKK